MEKQGYTRRDILRLMGSAPFVAPNIIRGLTEDHSPETTTLPKVYIVSPSGTADGDGSAEHPLNFKKAQELIQPGEKMLFSGGIYHSHELRFGVPKARNTEIMTEYAALPGERPIFTDPEGNPPTVYVGDYTYLKGLWFGGKKGAESNFFMGGSPIGQRKILEGCTIFNYPRGISQGSAKEIYYHDNRLIGNGNGRYEHSIYLSGGSLPGSMAHHIVFDRNTVIGDGDKNGWGIHGWHYPKNMLITGNFTADVIANVMGGDDQSVPGDNVVANNFFYRSTGSREEGGYVDGAWGMWVASRRTLCKNNIFTDEAPLIGKLDLSSHNISIGELDRDLGFLENGTFSYNDLPRLVGVSQEEIDAAISNIQSAFSQDIDTLYRNQDIENDFASLSFSSYPSDSLLHTLGEQWYDQSSSAAVGPAGAETGTFSEFWQAFPRHLLCEWDEWGEMTSCPDKDYLPFVSKAKMRRWYGAEERT